MMRLVRLLIVFLMLALSLGCSPSEPLAVSDAWVRATAPGQEAGAAYMTLSSSEDLMLARVESPAAGTVEIHMMSMEGDVMRMRMLENLPLKAGEPVQLEPGGYHLMLFDLKQPLESGTTVPFTLHLQDVQGKTFELVVDAPVRSAND